MTAFAVICASVLFFYLVKNLSVLSGIISDAFASILPITVGFILAYLLNPCVRILEYKFYYPLLKRKCKRIKNTKKTSHTLAAVSTILLFLLAVILFFYMVVPQLYASIVQLVSELKNYYNTLSAWVDKMLADYPDVLPVINNLLGTATHSLQDFAQQTLLPKMAGYMSQITSGLINVVMGIKDVLLGLIIAIYVMLYEKRLLHARKRLIATYFSPKATNRIFTLTRRADTIFSGFISGKILDSIIIGVLCFLLMQIFRIPYAVLISVIIGVTNVIPFFGPFIGAIPSVLLLLLVDPWQALYFGILIFVLQQFDGNFLGPMILGDSTGLNPFWVVVVILIGGSLGGFIGMMLGLPAFAFIYSIIKEHIVQRNAERNMPTEELAYEELHAIDPQTGAFIHQSRYPSDAQLAEHSFRQNFLSFFKRSKDRIIRFGSKFGSRKK